MRIALLGCGSIGKVIAAHILEKKVNAELAAVHDMDGARAGGFAKKFHTKSSSFEEILKMDVDLIVEAASPQAVREYVPRALEAKKSVMLMSAGALVDETLLNEIKRIAGKNGLKVYIPSGAIAGLDAIKSAGNELEKVTIKTTKPPSSLKGAPFFEKSGIKLDSIKTSTLIYEGPAEEAVKLFPFNVNVAASLSIAGIGPKKTMVQIVVDPNINANIHEIVAEGRFGVITTTAKNVPSPDNPKTSYLAALSAVATLKKISEPMQVGT